MGLPNVDIDINAPKIVGGLDIHGQLIGLPNVDIDINAPKIRGGINIKGPKIGGPSLDIHGPKFDAGFAFIYIVLIKFIFSS